MRCSNPSKGAYGLANFTYSLKLVCYIDITLIDVADFVLSLLLFEVMLLYVKKEKTCSSVVCAAVDCKRHAHD